jgi:hypothetical protein
VSVLVAIGIDGYATFRAKPWARRKITLAGWALCGAQTVWLPRHLAAGLERK